MCFLGIFSLSGIIYQFLELGNILFCANILKSYFWLIF